MAYNVYLHPKYSRKYEKLEEDDPEVFHMIKTGLNKLQKKSF